MPQPNRNGPLQPRRLSALDLDLAPDLPGIYAWYAQLDLSADDWRARISNGTDEAGPYLIRAVEDYAQIHEPTAMELKGNAAYGLNWFGSIRPQPITRASASSAKSPINERLQELAETEENRRLITNLLLSAPPVFASPLYIGVATNLRKRLAVHRDNFEEASKTLEKKPEDAARLQFAGENLGERLAGAGIPLERLECWYLTVAPPPTPETAQTQIQRSVSEAAEWIVQRIFHPILGRK